MPNTTDDGNRPDHYDVIIIGSGMGALTVASLMAGLRRKRVLVIERHFRAGGFTHDFEREGYRWDVGVHYAGLLHEGTMPRQVFDLITDGRVDWNPMPDPYEVFIYPGHRFQFRDR